MKTLMLIILSVQILSELNGQDLMNPYTLNAPIYYPYPYYNQNDLTIFPPTWAALSPPYDPGFKWANRQSLGGYNGEYEILLTLHPWNDYTTTGVGHGLQVSYGMETVSFPFTPDCIWQNNGCSSLVNSTDRFLYMPTAQYSNSSQSWGNLSNILPFPIIGDDDQTLASYGFMLSNALNVTSSDRVLPHTAIKHTVYVHCGVTVGSLPAPPVLYSFSWIYDNTRGRMRYYPFCNCNCDFLPNGCQVEDWDICFAPELLIRQDQGHFYNESDASILLPNGTIDYFPHSELLNLLSCSIPICSIPAWNAVYSTQSFTYPYFPQYSLISAIAFSDRGQNIAGYKEGPTGSHTVIARGGLKHTYHIDQNLDITVINPSEKTIYNPSEVKFTASANNFIFPAGYTFKTIRGVYPSPTEVAADDIVANGGDPTNNGHFYDLREVPVRTDLRCENNAYPHDPLIASHSVYASIYKLENLSQLTIQGCTRIFDATFDVDAGATLIFEDYNTVKNPDRFKILSSGGVIAKNAVTNQYAQYTTVTQPQPIRYTAYNSISAGTNVNPDPLATKGAFTLLNGSNIEFKAVNYISLKDGFSAKQGSTFKAHCGSIPVPTNCPAWSSAGGSGQRSIAQQKQPNAFTKQGLLIAPNPANENVSITCSAVSSGSIYIRDITGRIIFQQPFNMQSQLNTSLLTQGIYVAEVKDENGNSVKGKLIKE